MRMSWTKFESIWQGLPKWSIAIGALILGFLIAESAPAQEAPRHSLRGGDLTPGRIGANQLARSAALQGYFQPVEVGGPKGSNVGLPVEGGFADAQQDRAKAGMLIGQVYRFRITEIPDHPGFEVYPSIEVIDRLYPPRGQEARFPIPIHVSEEEIELALKGKFITRVIYVESPDTALPARQVGDSPRTTEVGPTEDPVHAADALGRPVAILRLGSRVPTRDEMHGLHFGFPPLQPLD